MTTITPLQPRRRAVCSPSPVRRWITPDDAPPPPREPAAGAITSRPHCWFPGSAPPHGPRTPDGTHRRDPRPPAYWLALLRSASVPAFVGHPLRDVRIAPLSAEHAETLGELIDSGAVAELLTWVEAERGQPRAVRLPAGMNPNAELAA